MAQWHQPGLYFARKMETTDNTVTLHRGAFLIIPVCFNRNNS